MSVKYHSRNFHILKDIESGSVGIYYTRSLHPLTFETEWGEDIHTKIEIPFEIADYKCVCSIFEKMLSNEHEEMKEIPSGILESLTRNGCTTNQCADILRETYWKFYDLGFIVEGEE